MLTSPSAFLRLFNQAASAWAARRLSKSLGNVARPRYSRRALRGRRTTLVHPILSNPGVTTDFPARGLEELGPVGRPAWPGLSGCESVAVCCRMGPASAPSCNDVHHTRQGRDRGLRDLKLQHRHRRLMETAQRGLLQRGTARPAGGGRAEKVLEAARPRSPPSSPRKCGTTGFGTRVVDPTDSLDKTYDEAPRHGGTAGRGMVSKVKGRVRDTVSRGLVTITPEELQAIRHGQGEGGACVVRQGARRS